MEGYTKVDTLTMEVVDVDLERRRVSLRTNARSCVMSGIYPLDICPEPARVAGGAFYLDVFRRDGEKPDYKLVFRTVDPEEERAELDRLFGDLET